MKLGLLWYDADQRVSPQARLAEAATRFAERFGRPANCCHVNPEELFADPAISVVGRSLDPEAPLLGRPRRGARTGATAAQAQGRSRPVPPPEAPPLRAQSPPEPPAILAANPSASLPPPRRRSRHPLTLPTATAGRCARPPRQRSDGDGRPRGATRPATPWSTSRRQPPRLSPRSVTATERRRTEQSSATASPAARSLGSGARPPSTTASRKHRQRRSSAPPAAPLSRPPRQPAASGRARPRRRQRSRRPRSAGTSAEAGQPLNAVCRRRAGSTKTASSKPTAPKPAGPCRDGHAPTVETAPGPPRCRGSKVAPAASAPPAAPRVRRSRETSVAPVEPARRRGADSSVQRWGESPVPSRLDPPAGGEGPDPDGRADSGKACPNVGRRPEVWPCRSGLRRPSGTSVAPRRRAPGVARVRRHRLRLGSRSSGRGCPGSESRRDRAGYEHAQARSPASHEPPERAKFESRATHEAPSEPQRPTCCRQAGRRERLRPGAEASRRSLAQQPRHL